MKKKQLMKVAVVAMLLTVSGQAKAQIDLGSIVDGITGATQTGTQTTKKSKKSKSDSTTTTTQSSGLGSLISGLTSIFDSSKTASADKIVGTWTYTEPAVVLSDDNVLKNLGGKVASAAIEKKLQTYFEKAGITKGKMTMTFDKAGNFAQSVGKKTMKGTYTVDGKDVTLTYSGGVKQFVGTTQLDGSKLLIVMDASKLLKYAKTIGSLTGNSTASTLGSLLSGYDGLEVGLTLEK